MKDNSVSVSFFQNNSSISSLEEFRNKVAMMVGWALLPFLFPFAVASLIQGRIILGFLISAVVFIAFINSIYILKTHQPRIPYWIFFTTVYMAVTGAILTLGAKSLFWCYPSLFVMSFVAERKVAHFLMGLALITTAPLAYYVATPETAVRFIVTLCLTCTFSEVLVNYLFKLNDKLIEFAIRDPLTNAFNRRHLDTYLQEAMEETRRDFGPASLVILDIDNFKTINDKYGHDAGDDVLKKIVDILHRRQRRLDYVFRIGGEEFLILLRNTSLQQAMSTAESLRKYIDENNLHIESNITISLGVAEYIEDESADEWMARADKHLYEAKKMGRNCVYPILDKPDIIAN